VEWCEVWGRKDDFEIFSCGKVEIQSFFLNILGIYNLNADKKFKNIAN